MSKTVIRKKTLKKSVKNRLKTKIQSFINNILIEFFVYIQ